MREPRRKGSARPAIALGTLLCALVLFTAATASADFSFGVSSTGNFSSAPGVFSAGPLAVDAQQGGDVYEVSKGDLQRVDQFQPNGDFVRAFGWGIVPGAASGVGDITEGSKSITNVSVTSGTFANGSGEFPSGGGKVITGAGLQAGTLVEAVSQSEIKLSKPATATATGVALTAAAGPGNVPVNEEQAVTVKATSGKFRLTFISPKPGSTSRSTPELSAGASAIEVQVALAGLANVGAGNVVVSGGPGDASGSSPYRIEFKNRFADTNVRRLVAESVSLAGGNPSAEVTVATPREGGGVMEACTTACTFPSAEENAIESGGGFGGSEPGQLRYNDAIAIDNDPASSSYGDVYLVDENGFRVVKYSPSGEFLLMFGGEVDKTTGADICTKADLEAGDRCGPGVSGTGPAHFYNEPAGGDNCGEGKQGKGSFGCDSNNSIAVGTGGVVYVGDFGRVQEFEPDGAFAGEIALHSATSNAIELAVDSACAQHEPPLTEATVPKCSEFDPSDGDVYVHQAINEGSEVTQEVPGVQKYSAAGAELGTVDASGTPELLATDAAGHLYIGQDAEPEYEILDYAGSGVLFANFSSPQIEPMLEGSAHEFVSPHSVKGIAVSDAAGELYATNRFRDSLEFGAESSEHIVAVDLPQAGAPQAKAGSERATDLEPTTATLHAVVNPEGSETEYSFQYITEKKFHEDGDSFGAGTVTAPNPPGQLSLTIKDDPVQLAVSDLEPATKYRFRVVAQNQEGEAQGEAVSFETLPPVAIRDFTTQTVGPETVVLKAELSPDNGSGTEYTMEIGEAQASGGASAHGTISGVFGNEFEEVTATFEHLKPNHEYHYRLTAQNSYGIPVNSGEQTLRTEPSLAEERQLEAEICPNVSLREEDGSTGLPDCRAYEQVSPVEKAGTAVNTGGQLAPSGERATFSTPVAFGDAESSIAVNPFVAVRTPSGWVSQAALRSPSTPGYLPVLAESFNAELDHWIYHVGPGTTRPEVGEQRISTSAFAVGSAQVPPLPPVLATPPLEMPAGEVDVFADVGQVVAASQNFDRIFIVTNKQYLSTDHRGPHEGRGPDRIYEVTRGQGTQPTIKLYAELPSSLVAADECQIDASIITSEGSPGIASASSDGSTLFYTAPAQANSKCNQGPNASRLFARTGSAAPVAISVPPAAQCHSPSPCSTATTQEAFLAGISPDASRAWFTTAQPLVDSDTDATNDLYLARMENGSLKELVQASGGEQATDPTPGTGANVQGVVGTSTEGARAYFVARGVLTAKPNENGAQAGESAATGADNLYAYDAETEQTQFVARLCSAGEKSGSIADSLCPTAVGNGGDTPLWGGAGTFNREAHVTPDGRYLLFTSYARLTPDDTDNAPDVYRYDFETGELIRVSFGRRGNDGSGNDDRYPALTGAAGDSATTATPGYLDEAAEDASRAISADGSKVVFRTAAPLVAADTNAGTDPGCGLSTTGCDVYEWEEDGAGTCREPGGCVFLLSTGLDPHGVLGGVISSSGRDVTFITSRGLISSDRDSQRDMYDARVDGGFPVVAPPIPCTSADTCHEAAPPQPGQPSFSSEAFVGGGNGPREIQCGKGRHRASKHGQVRCVPNRPKRHSKKKHHRGHGKRARQARGGAR